MPAGEAKEKNMIKSRMVVLAQMFYEHTDQEHPMTGLEILEYLKEHDVPANEKTLRGDIKLLQDLGLDIVKVVSRPNLFYWGERQFEMPELKLLVDAVSSSRFITKKKSNVLGKKLAQLASENQRKELRRNIQATNRVKSENEAIYYSVNTVNEAISRRRKIRFQYTQYGPDLKEMLRGDGEVYELSPYALLWNEDYYYVVGWSDKHNNVSVFRVDRLDRPVILDEKAVKRPEGFNLDDYSAPIFDMFEGPERVPVKLEVRNDLAKYIVDRFGTKLKTKQISDDRFTVEVEVSLSPTFYAWVFQFAGGMRILKPKKAVDEIMEMVNKFVERETL
ncbi:MAG: WYL domain-containing protein [Clostridiales bacterium]|nr:WYL domain-containing protein [Clostridiales bacterium]MBR0455276.1 WYL domain-containing protein [Bacillota bacterium]